MIRIRPTRRTANPTSTLRFTGLAAVLMAGALSLQTLGTAQQSAPGTAALPTIKVEVRQVLVPVVVTDKRGHSVTGLKAADFEVLEDGVAQRLTWFGTSTNPAESPARLPGAPAATPAAAATPLPLRDARAPQRTYLVCLDTLNSAFESFSRVRSALQKLFKEQESGPDTTYGLVALGRQPVIIQNLTQDPAKVLAALGSKELNRAILQSETGNLAAQESELSQALSSYCGQCPCAGEAQSATATPKTGSSSFCDGKKQSIEIWAGGAAREQSALTRDFLGNLDALAAKVAELPGKRILIFVSDGFNLRPGRNLFALLASYFDDPRELQSYFIDNLQTDLDRVLRLATGRDVTFYTLDSRGLYTTGSAFSADDEYRMSRITVLLPQVQQQRQTAALENQDAMAELAQTTGGVFFHNSNDLFKGMHQALADGREYYLLAYNSTHNTADGKFRQITVKVSGKDRVVRAKRGYWAASPAAN